MRNALLFPSGTCIVCGTHVTEKQRICARCARTNYLPAIPPPNRIKQIVRYLFR